MPVPVVESSVTIRTSSEECHSCRVILAKFSCAKCQTVKYCSKDCQTRHWKAHKTECQVKNQEEVSLVLPTTSSDKIEVLRAIRMSGISFQISFLLHWFHHINYTYSILRRRVK